VLTLFILKVNPFSTDLPPLVIQFHETALNQATAQSRRDDPAPLVRPRAVAATRYRVFICA